MKTLSEKQIRRILNHLERVDAALVALRASPRSFKDYEMAEKLLADNASYIISLSSWLPNEFFEKE